MCPVQPGGLSSQGDPAGPDGASGRVLAAFGGAWGAEGVCLLLTFVSVRAIPPAYRTRRRAQPTGPPQPGRGLGLDLEPRLRPGSLAQIPPRAREGSG